MAEEKKVEINYSAENTLESIATFILVAGIIATLICAFSIVVIRNPEYVYIDSYIFNTEGFVITVAVFLSTLTSWASMKVFANISRSLKEINSKIK